MVTLVSRTGRHLQRYHKGGRQVVGCIPYRYRKDNEQSLADGRTSIDNLEVLIISSPKGSGMLFPRGRQFRRNRLLNSSSHTHFILVILTGASPKKMTTSVQGGWETDESMEEAALRETMEEAGVTGSLESTLGYWRYKGKSNNKDHHGYMFPLLVEHQLDLWPDKNVRQRRWVTAAEAKQVCHREWMKEALDVLVSRLMDSHYPKDEAV